MGAPQLGRSRPTINDQDNRSSVNAKEGSMTKAQKAEQEEARERLREWIKPGDTVWTVVRHVSKSGMTRDIACYLIEDNEPRWIASLVAKACGMRFNRDRDAVRIGGCGMDMGFALVYDLSHALFGGGFECIGEGCPSNDHSNGDRDYTPHPHSDSGYALTQRWI